MCDIFGDRFCAIFMHHVINGNDADRISWKLSFFFFFFLDVISINDSILLCGPEKVYPTNGVLSYKFCFGKRYI